jgi:tRNA(fMet)-specific endonuclease VapC
VNLSLDTNVVIEFVRNRNPIVRDRYLAALAAGDRLMISLVVLYELEVGAERHHDRDAERQRVQFAVSRMQVAPFDELDMTMAARLRVRLERRGRAIGPYDTLIAGQAMARDWTLVTANRPEFGRIEGLNVIDWTIPAD